MKRFYNTVTTAAAATGGWQVLLDGRPIKTAGGALQIVPTAALADALAAEWQAQGETIDPAGFALRDLADYAIDVVAAERAAVIAALIGFAQTDTLCYRADPEDALHTRQLMVWDPHLQAAEERWGLRFERIAGVIHRPQPPATLARLEQVVAAHSDCTLSALHTLTALAASLVIGLAALEPDADIAALWNAANLEEDWQAELWGKDHEALAHRARRSAIFADAARFAAGARA